MSDTTPITKSAFVAEQRIRDTQIPIQRWAYVTVVFTTPDQDVDIPHPFRTDPPESIRWMPVAVNGAAYLYREGGGTPKPWQPTHIFLRASAPCTARLLLFVERP